MFGGAVNKGFKTVFVVQPLTMTLLGSAMYMRATWTHFYTLHNLTVVLDTTFKMCKFK